MLKTFIYKDKERKVLVTKEDASYIEGIDFSYIVEDLESESIKKFIEKYSLDKLAEQKKDLTPDSEKKEEIPVEKKKELSEEEKAEWKPYMKYFRKYLKSGISYKEEKKDGK